MEKMFPEVQLIVVPLTPAELKMTSEFATTAISGFQLAAVAELASAPPPSQVNVAAETLRAEASATSETRKALLVEEEKNVFFVVGFIELEECKNAAWMDFYK